MEGSDVNPMFPVLVWKVQLYAEKKQAAINATNVTALARIRRDMPQLALGQERQFDQTLLELEEFQHAIFVSTGRPMAEPTRIRLFPANAAIC